MTNRVANSSVTSKQETPVSETFAENGALGRGVLSGRLFPAGYPYRDTIPVDWPASDDSHFSSVTNQLDSSLCLSIGNLLEAIDWQEDLENIFGLAHCDRKIDRALTAALVSFLRNLSRDGASACGLMVGALREFMSNHEDLAEYLQ